MKDRTTIQVSEEIRKEIRILASKRDVSYQKLLTDMIDVFNEIDREKTIVSVPKKLAEKIKKSIEGTDMKSVSEYVAFVLRLILSEGNDLKRINEEKIKKKLRQLGYM